MRTILSILLLMALLGQVADDQSTVSVQGIVRDEQRVLIPGVQITLTNSETKETYKARSNEAGEYKLQIPVGIYSVTAELSGFDAAKVSEVKINQNEPKRLDAIRLRIARSPTDLPIERDVIPIPLAPVPNQPSNRL